MAQTFTIADGTSITWKPTGGTYSFNVTGLATASMFQGASGDLGASRTALYTAVLQTKFVSAPTTGTVVRLALAWSIDGITFSAGLSGTAGAVTNLGKINQLDELRFLSADGSTGVQLIAMNIRPKARYVLPVLYNVSGIALSSTAADHCFTLVPQTETVT